jgi:hypothetical protein
MRVAAAARPAGPNGSTKVDKPLEVHDIRGAQDLAVIRYGRMRRTMDQVVNSRHFGHPCRRDIYQGQRTAEVLSSVASPEDEHETWNSCSGFG